MFFIHDKKPSVPLRLLLSIWWSMIVRAFLLSLVCFVCFHAIIFVAIFSMDIPRHSADWSAFFRLNGIVVLGNIFFGLAAGSLWGLSGALLKPHYGYALELVKKPSDLNAS